jgi:hypothetical protein
MDTTLVLHQNGAQNHTHLIQMRFGIKNPHSINKRQNTLVYANLTSDSNRSLRSLGRAKSRLLNKRLV